MSAIFSKWSSPLLRLGKRTSFKDYMYRHNTLKRKQFRDKYNKLMSLKEGKKLFIVLLYFCVFCILIIVHLELTQSVKVLT